MLTVPSPLVFSYYCDLVLWHQPGQGLVWSIAVFEFTVLTVFPFLGTCRDGTVRLTYHINRMFVNEQGVLVPPVPKVCECLDEVGFSWLLEGSSFDPARSVVTIPRSSEIHWTVLSSLDTWFQ